MIWLDQDQDVTLNQYILPHWPDLPVIVSYDQFRCFGYKWRETVPEPLLPFFRRDFVRRYLANDSNPLSRLYRESIEASRQRVSARGDDPEDYLGEGDTPGAMFILDNGLRSWEDPSYGGWGGRYRKVRPDMRLEKKSDTPYYSDGKLLGAVWIDTDDSGDRFKPIWRWAKDFQNEFAARMLWCTEPYSGANHPPCIQIEEGLDLTARAGESITLTAAAWDPDGDPVTVSFWQYAEADSFGGQVSLTQNGNRAELTVPLDARVGDRIHIIAQATDQGEIPLSRYRRVIVTVRG